jgi:hypothetical protein
MFYESDNPDDRFFDLRYEHPVEIVPYRPVCGSCFDPYHRYTRVRRTHDEFIYEIQVGDSCYPYALEQLQEQIFNEYYPASLTPLEYREAFGDFLGK